MTGANYAFAERMSAAATLTPRLTGLLAVAAGATVANLYYSQPLLADIARSLHATAAAVSAVPTATQLGYASGLLLLVPLGDSLERRRLLVLATLCSALMLLAVALAPSLNVLIGASFLLGMSSVAPQLAVPFAAHLAVPESRGRSVGIVMSGLLVGILLSRTLSGLIGAVAGWRSIYLLAIVVMLVLALLLQRNLPRLVAAQPIAYRRLLASLVELLRTEPVLRRHALIGACGFAAFSLFWTTLALHLSQLSPPSGSVVAGLFGLIGLTGALIAPLAGRLADRVSAQRLNGGALLLVLLSFGVMAWHGGSALGVLALGVVLLDAGVQASHLSNQTRIYALHSDLRNRLNAVYMVVYFLGGASGSMLGGYALHHGGWLAVCMAGAGYALLGLLAVFSIKPAAPVLR